VKDKLFIFGNYEGVRDKVGNPLALDTPVTVPVGDPSVSLPDAVAECTAAGTCSQMSLNLIPLFPSNPGPSTLLNLDYNNLNREDNAIIKADYRYSAKHTFFGTYFFGDSLQTEEDTNVINPLFLSQAKTRAQVFGAGWIWMPNARFTNQLRFGFNNFWQQVLTDDHNINPNTFGINTGVTDPLNFGLPAVRISGFNRLGGSNSWPLFTTPNRTYQIFDTASLVIGAHSLHFGGEFRTGSTDNLRNTYGKGEIRFNSHGGLSALENFTQGFVQQATVFVGDSHRDVSQKSFGFFVQDSWRAAKRLTVNAGLRYDLSLPIREAHDLLGNFDPAVGLVQVGHQISKPYNTDYNNFAPRLGVAWDFSGKGTTVLRAAGGVMYEIPHISVFIGQNVTEAMDSP
jgi:outer membrane receptor protein involved in Fe transport